MKKKKTYKKPEITRVELKPEEAVLTACKSRGVGPSKSQWCNPGVVNCNNRRRGS